MVAQLALAIVVILFVLTANIGIALWIGEVLGKSYYGFFVVAGFYVLAGLIIYNSRHQWIKDPVSNAVISQMLKQKTV